MVAVVAVVAEAKVKMGTKCKLLQEGAGLTTTTQEPHSIYQGRAPMQMPSAGQPIPYIPAGFQSNQQSPPAPRFSNIVKECANQNVCFTHGFDVVDWHTSATCKQLKTWPPREIHTCKLHEV